VAALVLASLLWGTADVAGKLALGTIPPATLAALRFGVALAILWPLARLRGGACVPPWVTAPLGLLGVALTFLLQNLGLHRTTATNASLLQGAAPVLILLLGALVLDERLGARRVAAVGLAMAGVAAVTLAGAAGWTRRGWETYWCWLAAAASPPSWCWAVASSRSTARSPCWPAWRPGARRHCCR
jgi:drug/metabolite transporter (DMT)-like permease